MNLKNCILQTVKCERRPLSCGIEVAPQRTTARETFAMLASLTSYLYHVLP